VQKTGFGKTRTFVKNAWFCMFLVFYSFLAVFKVNFYTLKMSFIQKNCGLKKNFRAKATLAHFTGELHFYGCNKKHLCMSVCE